MPKSPDRHLGAGGRRGHRAQTPAVRPVGRRPAGGDPRAADADARLPANTVAAFAGTAKSEARPKTAAEPSAFATRSWAGVGAVDSAGPDELFADLVLGADETGLCAGCGLFLARRGRLPTAPVRHVSAPGKARRPESRSGLRDARHLLALTAWCVCVGYTVLAGVDTPAEGTVFTGLLPPALTCAIPEFLTLALPTLSEHEPKRRPGDAAKVDQGFVRCLVRAV